MTRIHAAEVEAGTNLLDGFAFRESYLYIDSSGHMQPSQQILDDTESLYRDAPVYRYDTDGSTGSNPDRDYLHTILAKTQEIFGRPIDVALTEYLPAGPVQISESDTSRYADIDFICTTPTFSGSTPSSAWTRSPRSRSRTRPSRASPSSIGSATRARTTPCEPRSPDTSMGRS